MPTALAVTRIPVGTSSYDFGKVPGTEEDQLYPPAPSHHEGGPMSCS